MITFPGAVRITTGLALLMAIVSTWSFAADNNGLLKELRIKKGQEYSLAKANLIKQGWHIAPTSEDLGNADQAPPYGFKEVICGNGYDAVCSAHFVRKNQEIMLTLRPKKHLLVDGAWND
jgi:hypothetical protein